MTASTDWRSERSSTGSRPPFEALKYLKQIRFRYSQDYVIQRLPGTPTWSANRPLVRDPF